MKNRERIIDVKALIRCIAEKWRLLLLVGVLAGIAFAGVKGYSQYKLYKLSQGQQDTAQEETGPQKGKILNEVRTAETNMEEYYINSIIGDINPYKEGKATADIIVSTSANAAAGETQVPQSIVVRPQNIGNYYSSTVLYRIDYTQVAAELGVEPQLLGELVTVTTGTQDPAQITVSVIYPTPEGAKQILDAVLTQVRAAHEEAQRAYGAHELLIANEASAVVVDSGLFKWANGRATEIIALVNCYKTLNNNLSSSSAPSVVSITRRGAVITAVKSGIIGLLAGIVAAIVLIAIHLLATGKVLSGREFNRHFGTNKIACVPGRKFTILKGVDKWVASIDSNYYNHPQRNVCLQVADAAIRAAVRPDAQIALVGDLPMEYLDKLAAEMNKSGAVTGLRTFYYAIPCMEQTPDGVVSIVNCDAAVIVAKTEKSTYRGAEDILDACALLGRDVIGSIVLM